MVTDEELKDKLRDEKIKAIYDSIDYEELDRKEKKYKAYKEHIKKDLHPISYQVMIESRDAPQPYGMVDIEAQRLLGLWELLYFGYAIFWVGIGALAFLAIIS
jgi:hypothetical protein